ncbi:MAG: hypothetical protein ACFFB5_23305 [Promethearchaeota archaeon]
MVTRVDGQSIAQEWGATYFEMAVDDLKALDTVLKSHSQKVITKS